MDIFEKVLDSIYPMVFIVMIPIGIYGFISVTSRYEERNSQPTWYEETLARSNAALKRGLERSERLQKQSPLEKGHPPMPKLYKQEDNNFSIPLEQLLEGNHGRIL